MTITRTTVTKTNKIALENAVFEPIRLDDGQLGWIRFTTNEAQSVITNDPITVNGRDYRSLLPNIAQDLLTLPTGPGTPRNPTELLNEIEVLLREAILLNSDSEYKFIASYVFATWMYDQYSHVSYLSLTGPPGSGKSQLLSILRKLVFRGLAASGADSFASTFRMIHMTNGCLTMDEAQRDASNPLDDFHKLLSEGNATSGAIRRMNDEMEVEIFRVFGPKIFSGRSYASDEAITSRTYEIVMTTRTSLDVRNLPGETRAWQQRADQLRNNLMLYRQMRLTGQKAAPGLEFLRDERYESLSLREQQTINWILFECPSTEMLNTLLTCAFERSQSSGETRGLTLDAQVMLACYEIVAGDSRPPLVRDVQFKLEAWGVTTINIKLVANILRSYRIATRHTRYGLRAFTSLQQLSNILSNMRIDAANWLANSSEPGEAEETF